MTEQAKAWWEETAASFQAEIGLDAGVNWNGLGHGDLDLLDDVAGADVLELGCGGGQCSVALARRGANVTGIDLSTEQLAHPFYELFDPETAVVEESYFDTGCQVTVHDDLDADVVTYRHSVSGVYNALVAADFRVERMLEPGTDDPDAYEEGPWGHRTPGLMSKVPATLVFDARKR